MNISTVAKLTGLSIHTLRYYEKEGLLPHIARDKSGHRFFSERDLEWITWIKRLKMTGMSLEDIKRFSAFRQQGDTGIKPRRIMLEQHAEKLRQDVQLLLDELAIVEYKIEAYAELEKKA